MQCEIEINYFVSQHSNLPTKVDVYFLQGIICVIERPDNCGMSLFAALPLLSDFDRTRFGDREIMAVLSNGDIGYFRNHEFLSTDRRELLSRFPNLPFPPTKGVYNESNLSKSFA